MMYRRLKLIGKVVGWRWSLIGKLLIFVVPVRSVAQCLPQRDILARRMWGFTVDISPVALVTELFLFLRISRFH